MARGRFVSKSISTSNKRGLLVERYGTPCPTCGGSLAEFAQVLYVLLLLHTDDFGREEADVFTVKHKVDPLSRRTREEFTRALVALQDVDLIEWYSDGHRLVASIVDFDTHQQGLHKRTRSDFAEPPGESGKPPEIPSEEKRREEKGREEERGGAAASSSRNGYRKPRPQVKPLTAMVLKDVLPLHLTNRSDIIEAAKHRAAELHLVYDGASIDRAIASAIAQAKKGVPV